MLAAVALMPAQYSTNNFPLAVILALPSLSSLKELNVAQGIGGDDAADGADAVRSVDHPFI
jgi:hypothetical protein